MGNDRLLFVSNFNTTRETIYFGYMINKMSIKRGYIVIELLFENKVEAMSAYNSLCLYAKEEELTKVISLQTEQIELEINIIAFWHSISTKKRVIIEIEMPR